MNILVFNCGSSSLKYRLLRLPGEAELAGGEARRIGPRTAEPAHVVHRVNGITTTHYHPMPDHGAAFSNVMQLLERDGLAEIDAIGHRMVHGGGRFADCALVDEAVIAGLEETSVLAPLHNPPAISLVKSCARLRPELPEVVVFDTAFHSGIPEYARNYAIPGWMREEIGVRKYGFHGISHEYVTTEAARFLGIATAKFNAVSCHLGSGGASLCAVVNGLSVDNTMGYSPLQGLIMSTRSGSLDPSVPLRLFHHLGCNGTGVEDLLNKKSGVLGLSGSSSDIRDALAAAVGDGPESERARAVADAYAWRIRKHLGAYLAVVGRADAVIFTDTVGEEVPPIRYAVCAGMEDFGLAIDRGRNEKISALPADVATDESRIRILVVKTDEEMSIARTVHRFLTRQALAVCQDG
ncbi:MAG TPA: acetate/propionate family kinase [Candidatus Brocadiia bacterium]|nr:acetate/propionate family kinase [Candidatus Brocadiia bacterium]